MKTQQRESNRDPEAGVEVTDLDTLQFGDRVLFGDRKKPLTVTDIGTRSQGFRGQSLETTVVRVKGGWKNSVPYVLAHVTRTLEGDEVNLEKKEQIVACERGDLEKGKRVTLLRVGALGDDR